MATRRLVTRSKGRLKGIRSALRVALFPGCRALRRDYALIPMTAHHPRLQPLPVTAPAALPSVRRGRNR